MSDEMSEELSDGVATLTMYRRGTSNAWLDRQCQKWTKFCT